MKANQFQQWTIRLKVSSEERKQIHKDAIDRGLSIADYVKLKLLQNSSHLSEGKSA